jgi:hypothetical protein
MPIGLSIIGHPAYASQALFRLTVLSLEHYPSEGDLMQPSMHKVHQLVVVAAVVLALWLLLGGASGVRSVFTAKRYAPVALKRWSG